jgi:hypothetical protein
MNTTCETDIEEWRDVVGFDGIYKVSNMGNVKSFMTSEEGKSRKLTKAPNGYLNVILRQNEKEHMCKVHRLVAQAFIPNPNNLPQVNHINGIKDDNMVGNLEWCDGKYNSNYTRTLNPNFGRGENCYNSKYKNEEILDVYALAWEEKLTCRQIADKYGMNPQYVRSIKFGKKWAHLTKHNSSLRKPKHSFGENSAGEANYSSKLTKSQAIEVYNLAWEGKLFNTEIGKMYDIKPSTVRDIKTGRIWNSVTHHKDRIKTTTK